MDRRYHHGDLRQALLAALDAAVRNEGPEGASTRALAREVGVAPSAVFRHFRDRRALLTAYAAEGFVNLASAVEAAGPRPLDMAAAYMDFAFADPGRFRTMFRADLLDIEDPDLRHGQDALERALGLRAVLEIGSRENDMPVLLHGAVHGLATLAAETPLRERLPDDPVERRAALLTMLRRLTSP